jgi:hypothetical protein
MRSMIIGKNGKIQREDRTRWNDQKEAAVLPFFLG